MSQREARGVREERERERERKTTRGRWTEFYDQVGCTHQSPERETLETWGIGLRHLPRFLGPNILYLGRPDLVAHFWGRRWANVCVCGV